MSERPLTRTSLARHLAVSVDRDALRAAILGLSKPGGEQEWCIACGAGKDASPLDKVENIHAAARDLIGGKSLQEFVSGIKDLGTQAWCIACGAGKDASPLDRLGNPADITDDMIDQVASRLIGALRIG
jgi:hypothetical protein